MNLLVKKMGLVLLPALFFACEDPTELGAGLNPNTGNVSVLYEEFTIQTSQLRSDSLYTSLRFPAPNSALTSPLYIGRAVDEDFGVIEAEIYANLGLPATLPTIGTFTRLDSAKLEVGWTATGNYGVYGNSLIPTQRYRIHKLTEPIASTGKTVVNDSVDVYSYNYFAGQTRTYGEQIGELSLNIANYAANLDTAALRDQSQRLLSTRIDQAAAEQLFNALKTNEGGIRNSQEAFANYFKGIALVPAETNTFLTSFNVTGANSGITLYYTQGTEQRSIRLPFGLPSTNTRAYRDYPVYFALNVDRMGTGLTPAATAGHLQEFQPTDGRVYFQGITGIYPKFEFATAFKAFLEAQNEGLIVLNRAYIEVDSVLAGTGRKPLPTSFELYFVGDDNNRVPATLAAQGAFEKALFAFRGNYTVGQTSVNYLRADVVYNLEQFMRTGDEHYLQAVIYPTDGAFYAPNSFVVRPGQVKLKVWYTKVTGAN